MSTSIQTIGPALVRAPDASAPQPTPYLSCAGGGVWAAFPPAESHEPIVETQDAITASISPSSSVQLTIRTVSRTTVDASFSISWVEYPADLVKSKGAGQILWDVEHGGIAGRGTLESDRVLEIEENPARLYSYVRTKIPGRARVLAILRGNRLYEVQVQSSSAETIDARITKDFFASLKFYHCKDQSETDVMRSATP